MSLVTLQQVEVGYGGPALLNKVDFTIEPGERICIIGRNGVGKTTLLNCIMGLIQVKSGGLMFDGNDMLKLSAEKRAPLGVGYVPQGRMIFPLMIGLLKIILSLPMKLIPILAWL